MNVPPIPANLLPFGGAGKGAGLVAVALIGFALYLAARHAPKAPAIPAARRLS